MVPALLFLLVKKYVVKNWPAIRQKISGIVVPKNFLLMIGFIFLLLLKLISLNAQDKQLQYNIVRNGKIIGWTKLVRTTTDQQVNIKLQTEVKTRFVFQFVVKALEEAVFNNGNLVYSSQFRKLNSDVKENKSMRLTDKGYELHKGNSVQTLPITRVRHHMLALYFEEPVQGGRFYSDSFQQFLDIEKVDSGAYKIRLPDGNSCSYYYKNGICTNIKIDHRFYSAEMMLSPNVN